MNITRIKNILTKAIAKAPTTIVLKRDVQTSDGMGGYTKGAIPTTVVTTTGVLNNSTKGNSFRFIQDSGQLIKDDKIVLILLYSTSYSPTTNDFFAVNEINYNIKKCNNMLNLNIYWECELEVKING